MVLMHWFERGLGQVVAPDDNYQPNPDKLDTASKMWQTLAPDPNFMDNDDDDRNDATRIGAPPPPQAFRHARSSMVQCVHCKKYTPAVLSTPATATPASSSKYTGRPPFSSSTTTPCWKSPSARVAEMTNHDLDARVLQAAHDLARSLALSAKGKKIPNTIFRWVCGPEPKSDAQLAKLRDALERPEFKHKMLYEYRSAHVEMCPNGLTLFLAACHQGQLGAARVIWDVSNHDVELLRAVTVQGQTAQHLAAEMGHDEMLDLLQQLTLATPLHGMMPVDLAGQTPLATAMTSTQGMAKKNRPRLEQKLFSPDDAALWGSPAPIWERTATQPDLQIVLGTADMPGKRIYHEDAILCQVLDHTTALVAVCDGHEDNGEVSQFVVDKFVLAWLQTQVEAVDDEVTDYAARCHRACLMVDEQLRATKLKGGSTGVFAVITPTHIVVANVGDSRAILVQQSRQHDITVQAMSEDHKPNLPAEKERIEAAGLTVSEERFTVMVNGQELERVVAKVQLSDSNRMACSRTFGDFEYKEQAELPAESQAVTAVPDVIVYERQHDDAILVLACDGIWDVMTNDEVGAFVAERVDILLQSSLGAAILPQVGDELLAECLRRESGDNMSVVLVALSHMADRISGGGSGDSMMMAAGGGEAVAKALNYDGAK